MDLLWNELDHQQEMRDLATRIYRAWLQAVGRDRADEAATTLLMAACNANGHVRTWQLGDGMVLIRSHGQVRVLTPRGVASAMRRVLWASTGRGALGRRMSLSCLGRGIR